MTDEHLLREWAADPTVSQREAGKRLGIAKTTLQKRCAQLGIQWSAHAKAYANAAKGRRDAVCRVRVGEEMVSIREAAQMRGLKVSTVEERWRQGDRTARRLLRPAKADRFYDLGLSMRDWEAVLEYARDRGRAAAAKKFAVPYGAIRLVQDGHWECVA